MPTIRYHGLTGHYTDTGSPKSRETVVLLHAGGSSSRQWRKIAPVLENEYRLVAPDLIGFGDSESWTGLSALSHDDQAGLVRHVIAAAGDRPVHLVGHSYGGATAVRLALAHPHLVRSMVLIEPILTPLLEQDGQFDVFGRYRLFAGRFLALADVGRDAKAWRHFIDHRNGDGTWRSLSDKARARFLARTTETAAAFRSNLKNPTTLADCRRLAMPTLVLCGENTTEPERRVTEILNREIPNCAYGIVPEAEHMSPLTHPQQVGGIIRNHLRQVALATPAADHRETPLRHVATPATPASLFPHTHAD